MKLIFYIIVAYVVYRVATRLFPPMKVKARYSSGTSGTGQGSSAQEPKVEETVLDPVCGSYLAKDLAVKIKKDGKTVYFCGDECRDKFSEGG